MPSVRPRPTVAARERAARPFLLAALVALAFLLAGTVRAQAILVAPQGVVLDARTRTASVELYNPGDRASEVALSTLYGYPVSTADGEITLRTVEHPDSAERSAAGFIEAFPRRLVLQPGQRQTVRLLARPPQGLAAGEYWARLVVAAKDAAPAAADTAGDGVRVGLTLEVRTIIAVNYRTGPLATGIALGAPDVALRGDSVVVRVPMTRTGDAAWIGATSVRLEPDDATVAAPPEQRLQTAVYTTLAPRLVFPRSALARGRWRVRIVASSDRPDVVQRTHLRAAAAQAETTLVVP